MEGSSNKITKLTQSIPDDLVEHLISMYLPVQSLLRNRTLSKQFMNTAIQSRNLDFSGIYSRRRRQSEVVSIIEKVFNQYKGSKIERFVLVINHLGVEDKVISWINTCLGKNIKDIVLDFSKSKKVMEIPINFSDLENLQDLKLRSYKFEILDNSPKGLKLLRMLSLMRSELKKETIVAIFSNCFHLESLELTECRMDGMLNIQAQNHKKFKSLVLSSMRGLWNIHLDAPSLEIYKYNGYVIPFNFVRTYALRDTNLHYNRNFSPSYYDSSDLVVHNMSFFTNVSVLATTTIFLEALTHKHAEGGKFENPTFCTLFDIAEFLKECPRLEGVVIDIHNFTFATHLPFWETDHKDEIENNWNNKYLSGFLKKVKIFGYKGYPHELDIRSSLPKTHHL
ncbi:PREDICTED: FBD-associated F-box protein At1g61320-like [Camelina sativa]|uniref:FBD-associated F-box protein At1g61320-like n=1 Tax=Camelina sativa TaxID=90675 RepID=A0ABM1Q8C4_CAMSA|nr:PREDICTED: FBD-associated F-box protein At1g61320-like [Camelina sativa]